MCATGKLTIAVLIEDDRIRERFLRHFQALCDSSEVRADGCFREVDLQTVPSLDKLVEALSIHSKQDTRQSFIVVADTLVSDGAFDLQAKERIDPHFEKPLVTLAITEEAHRVPDIDQVAKPTATRRQIAGKLEILTKRLAYMALPVKREFPHPIVVRRIANEYELHQYYQLRHEVYRIMGYMHEKKEQVTSKQEIDGCDTNAIHLGAFEMCTGYQRLVGTGRVLLAKADETKWAAWTRNLLKTDRRLRAMVRNETLSLGLPVFQSQQLNDHLQESFEQDLLCAELSRVIVANEFRGAGVARQMVNNAIQESQRAGVDRLYLECLRLHKPLYEKFSFHEISGTGARVIGVNKSMLAMMMELAAMPAPART